MKMPSNYIIRGHRGGRLYEPGDEIGIAMDAAASEFYQRGRYIRSLPPKTKEAEYRRAMIDYYEALIEKYPIVSIEDGLAEQDWDGWDDDDRSSGRGRFKSWGTIFS